MNEKIQEMAKFARREASLYGGKFGDTDFTKRYNEKNRAKVRLTQRKTPVTPWDCLGVIGVTWGNV